MTPSEASTLRTRLRHVNLEYSALVRDRSGEGRFVRMDELKAERRALMALMAAGATGARRPMVSRQQPPVAQYSSQLTDRPTPLPANCTASAEGHRELPADVL
jgi:hypothetical protein